MTTETVSKKSLLTPFNVIAGLILLMGAALTVWRFGWGIGAVTNLDNNNPWGLWIGFDLLCGVVLAAGGFVTSSAVYLFGMKKHHAAVRPAILTAFLGYLFVVVALQYDLGRPWRLPYPFVVQSGTTSMLFEVGLCVALYLTVLFLEFSPAALEWLGYKRLRNLIHKTTIALTIFGVVLSTLHQSSLGALYIIAPSKLHPLWYSTYLPTFFFVSAIAAGMSMVMLEGWITHKPMHSKMSEEYLAQHDDLYYGFAKGASFVLLGYFFIKVSNTAKHVHYKKYNVSFFNGNFHVAVDCFFKNIIRIFNPSAGVDHRKFASFPLTFAVLAVAGSSGLFIYYSSAALGKPVKQGRFPHVRASYNCYYISHF